VLVALLFHTNEVPETNISILTDIFQFFSLNIQGKFRDSIQNTTRSLLSTYFSIYDV